MKVELGMNKTRVRVSIIVGLLSIVGLSPAHAQDNAKDIQSLQEQINKLSEELKALQTQQADTATKSEPAGNDIRVHWKEGLRLDSHNGDFKLKIGGRIQNDWAWISEGDDIKDAGINSQDGTEFRRARLYVGGTIYDEFEFKAQYDFEDGAADWKDVWMSAKNVPGLGKLKVGHFKEPFGLEELTSSKDITFMERSLTNAFVPSRNTGIAFSNSSASKRLTYSAGIFRETGKFGEGQSDSGNINLTGRITGLPIWDDEGDHYLHLGAAISLKDLKDGDSYGLDYTPETHLAEDLIDISVTSDEVDLFGLEAAYINGPFSIQSEYMQADVEGATGIEDAEFDAYYIMGSYFLTGEHRRYKPGSGIFDKIKPNTNFGFGEDKGLGAWELAARYSNIDLEDATYAGGELSDITLGVNWYLNPNMKIMMNYVHGELEDGILGAGEEDDVDTIQTRFQVTW